MRPVSVRRNVIANGVGQAWVAVMGLAFVPVYIRYLGIEAFGLVGLFAVMQAWLTLLDVGMTPTLGREMARYTSGAHSAQSIRDLLRSLEFVCFGIAGLIFIAVCVASTWLASDWLKVEKLQPEAVQSAIEVMAFVIASRFVESIYRSALFGLQRQVWYNSVNAILATFRSVGALAVLAWVSPTIETFFMWQSVVSLLSVVVFAFGVYRALPSAPRPATFSVDALRGVWRFAGGMTGITLLAVLLTQIDKVLLSRLLSLEAFGYYTLAATVSGALYLLTTPITTALFPRLVELLTRGTSSMLASAYHRGAQMVTVLTAPSALLLAFFGEGVLFAWTGNVDLARSAGPILSALALGNFLNGLMYVPYQLQLAHGWTHFALGINIAAVLLLVPAIFWVVPRYGSIGAAWVWIFLNAGYVLIGIQLMHRRLMSTEKWHWYVRDVGFPTLGAGIALLVLSGLKPNSLADRAEWFFFLTTGLLGALAISALTVRDLRVRMVLSIRGLWSK